MRHGWRARAARVGFAAGVAAAAFGGAAAAAEPRLDAVLAEVQRTLALVSEGSAAEGLPRPERADLTLKAALAAAPDGGLAFVAVGADSARKPAETQTLKVRLGLPDGAGDPVPGPAVAPGPAALGPADRLAAAILAAARGAKGAAGERPPPAVRSLTADLDFLVRDGAGAGFVLLPVGLQPGDVAPASATHALRVRFGEAP